VPIDASSSALDFSLVTRRASRFRHFDAKFVEIAIFLTVTTVRIRFEFHFLSLKKIDGGV
jgi:hypothetical protein